MNGLADFERLLDEAEVRERQLGESLGRAVYERDLALERLARLQRRYDALAAELLEARRQLERAIA
jgi:hypothetical protein